MNFLLNCLAFVLRLLGRRRIIYDHEDDKLPYIERYYLFGKRNHDEYAVCLHKILMSDMDVQHNHPADYLSWILWGWYWEHMGKKKVRRMAGTMRVNTAETFHRLELGTKHVWTIFAMCKRRQDWGFNVRGKLVQHNKHLGRDD